MSNSSIKNPLGFWTGIVILVVGLILLYLGIDFKNTNLDTFFDPKLIEALLKFLGILITGLGLLKAGVSYFTEPKSTS